MATQQLFTAADIFNAVFAHESIREVAFDEKWNNGTGYMDGAVRAQLGLKPGEIVKAETPAPNSRKLLIIGTPVGNICVFQRYTGGQNGVHVANAPRAIERMFDLGTKIGDAAMARLFGQSVDGEYFTDFNLHRINAGHLVDELVDEINHVQLKAG